MDQRVVPLLIDIVEDKVFGPMYFEDTQKLQLKAALGKIGGVKALASLKGRLNQEPDKLVKIAIQNAIAGGLPVLHWEFKSAESHREPKC